MYFVNIPENMVKSGLLMGYNYHIIYPPSETGYDGLK